MRFASDIAAALSATPGRSSRPSGWQLVSSACAYQGFFGWSGLHNHGSPRLKRQ